MNIRINDKYSINLFWPSLQIDYGERIDGRKNTFGILRMYLPKSDKRYHLTRKQAMVNVIQHWILVLPVLITILFLFQVKTRNIQLNTITEILVFLGLIIYSSFILTQFILPRSFLKYRMAVVSYGFRVREMEKESGKKYSPNIFAMQIKNNSDTLVDPYGDYRFIQERDETIIAMTRKYNRPFRLYDPVSWF